MDFITNLGLDSFSIGVLVGVLIGWQVLPQPEWIKPYLAWLTDKAAMISVLFKKDTTPLEPNKAKDSKEDSKDKSKD